MTSIDPYVTPFTDEERAVVLRAQLNFSCFLEDVFARSYDGLRFRMSDGQRLPFSLGDVHHHWALLAQTYNRVCVLAPRMHLKSTVLNHAFVFWRLFRGWGDVDAMVFSHTDQLAKEHLKITKRLIKINPYTRFWRDRKPGSDYLINFEVGFGDGDTWLGEAAGGGILAASRGFPMTMTLRMMHGVIVVHSEIMHPAGAYTDARGHVIDTFRADMGSSLVNNYELTTDQGKGFGTVLRNEHRFFQFVPEEGDYLGAVRANVVNLQDRGFLFQFRPPVDEAASPASSAAGVKAVGSTEAARGTPWWSGPPRRLGCVAVLISLGVIGALIATILDYSPYWDAFDGGGSVQVAAPKSAQNGKAAPAVPALAGFPDATRLLDKLGFDAAAEGALDANMTTLQPHDLFYSDSSKRPGLDASWLKIRAYTGGYVDVSASWANSLNQRFPCGSVADGARTTCAAGRSGFTTTGYWIGQMILYDKVPASDPTISFTFGFVAGDANPANNFRASLPFDKDLYNQTKYWYEFGHLVSSDMWSVQLRVFPQIASPVPTGAVVINSGDTVFWAIPEKELPAGDLHFNVTTFGFKALPPDPATAAVDALSDPRKPLPLAPRTMLSSGSSTGYPGDTPGAGQAPGTASFQTYLNEFADKFRVRDNAYLLDHLNPAVLQLFGADMCRASLALRKADPTFKIAVRSVTGPASFDFQADGKTIAVPGVYTVVAQVTVNGSAAEETLHFTYENGKLTWFTTCPAGGQ